MLCTRQRCVCALLPTTTTTCGSVDGASNEFAMDRCTPSDSCVLVEKTRASMVILAGCTTIVARGIGNVYKRAELIYRRAYEGGRSGSMLPDTRPPGIYYG